MVHHHLFPISSVVCGCLLVFSLRADKSPSPKIGEPIISWQVDCCRIVCAHGVDAILAVFQPALVTFYSVARAIPIPSLSGQIGISSPTQLLIYHILSDIFVLVRLMVGVSVYIYIYWPEFCLSSSNKSPARFSGNV